MTSSITPGSLGERVVEPSRHETPAPSAAKAAIVNSSRELQLAELQGNEYSISEKQLVTAIEQALKKIQGKQTSLNFTIHEKTKRILVKVLDSDTGEVVREIPPEKNLDFLANLWQMAGILIDEKR